MYHTTSEKLSYYVPPTLIHRMDQGLKVAKKQLCDLIASKYDLFKEFRCAPSRECKTHLFDVLNTGAALGWCWWCYSTIDFGDFELMSQI